MTIPKLFTPIQVGRLSLGHRVVLAPLTRMRADPQGVLIPLAAEYYAQRASTPGTLLITEGTVISPQAGGMPNVPGIWSDAQITAWKSVVDAVHEKGSYIYMQLGALGSGASAKLLQAQGFDYVAPSAIFRAGDVIPRALTTAEIKQYVQDHVDAAYNAVVRAGFDGVEIHSGNGHLLDQFLQDTSNQRTDEYGGSIDNRSRFTLEIVDAVAAKIGADRTGIRFSPWRPIGAARRASDSVVQDSLSKRMSDPVAQISHVVTELTKRHPSLAYVHVVEPRVDEVAGLEEEELGVSNDFIRDLWRPRPLISAGGYTRELALDVAEKKGDLIAFGRLYIGTPDLPLRLLKDFPMKKGDRTTYYGGGTSGYADYPTAEQEALL